VIFSLLLAVLLFGWTFLEARHQRSQIQAALTAQATVLASSLGPGLVAATHASRELDEIIFWKILDNARLLAELRLAGRDDQELLEELAADNGLDSVVFYDSDQRQLQLLGEGVPESAKEELQDLFDRRADELVLGTSLEDGVEHLGAAVRTPSDGVVLVRIHPSTARTFARRLGVENLLRKLVGAGGVLYLSYREEPSGNVVEVAWDDGSVPPSPPSNQELFDLRGRTALEVEMPIESPAGTSATLRVGLDGSALQRTASQTMWRSLLLGLILTGFAVSAAGFAVVSRLRAREREEAGERLAEAETARRRSERLAAAGALTAGMAHEVRSPMNAIGLAAQRLERKLSDNTDLRQIASRIRAEIDRLEGVLRGFLELASPVSDHRSETDLANVAREVLDLMSDEATDRGVLLAEVVGSATTMADRESIHRAAVNLVRNAIQASPPGGRVAVMAETSGRSALLRIQDEGAGLDAELDGRFFDPFVTGKSTGTGLGLALVKRVAEDHGGTVSLTDRKGGGAEAILSLPIDGKAGT
jgi:signal transduction histidine kinase